MIYSLSEFRAHIGSLMQLAFTSLGVGSWVLTLYVVFCSRLLHSMRVPRQSPKRASPWYTSLHQICICSLLIPTGQSKLHRQTQDEGGKCKRRGCQEAWPAEELLAVFHTAYGNVTPMALHLQVEKGDFPGQEFLIECQQCCAAG